MPKRKARKGRGKLKGGEFERVVARWLSLWWSNGLRDDLFWRTSGSGGRATRRAGKKTAGHYGDIGSTDPDSRAFCSMFAVEVKKGYNRLSLHDLIDRNGKPGKHEFEKWIEQAEQARRNAGARFWLIIHRRDRRKTMVYFPPEGWLMDLDASLVINQGGFQLRGVELGGFLAELSPLDVRRLSK